MTRFESTSSEEGAQVEEQEKGLVQEFLEKANTPIEKEISVKGYGGHREKANAVVSQEIIENNGEMIRRVFKVLDEDGADIKSADVHPVAVFDPASGEWVFDNSSY